MKLTNNNSIEEISHFNGGLSILEKNLACPTKFNRKMPLDPVGLISPKRSAIEFISKNYGSELAKYLAEEFDPSILDLDEIHLRTSIRKQISEIPNDWSDLYEYTEKVGLNFELTNMDEIRILTMMIKLLKLRIDNTY